MKDLFVITMEKMVSGGDCLGRLPDGRAVFVPFVLPGEVVQVNLIEEKKRFARGWPVELINSSIDRIVPRCIHFGECGGCQYQHLDYANQIALKETLIKDQFQRIANIEDLPIQPIIPSPKPWNYRNHVRFHLGKGGELGFVHADNQHLLIIDECHLPLPEINQLWPQLDLGSDSGVYRLGVRQDTFDSLMLVLEGDDPKPPEFNEDIPVSAIYTPPDARLTVLAGDDHLVYTLLDRHFQVSARSFFQVNTAMAEKMITFLLEHLHLAEDIQVIELYAGVGLFSAFIAPKVGHLIAIESSGSACHDFVINLDEFDNVDLYEAEAEEVLPTMNISADLVIMDPPRAGLALDVHDALAKLQPTQIAYISCDPATLARDTKRILGNGYQLQSVTPFDLFPHTAHIECISLFEIGNV